MCVNARAAPRAPLPHLPRTHTHTDNNAMASKQQQQEEPEPRSEQEVLARFNERRQAVAALAQRLGELEAEAAEHALVEKALGPMEPARRCYRMVGDVLVERTVGEVLPAVRRNREGLEGVVGALQQQLDERQRELSAFQRRYRISVGGGTGGGGGGGGGGPAPQAAAAGGSGGKGPAGVLAGA